MRRDIRDQRALGYIRKPVHTCVCVLCTNIFILAFVHIRSLWRHFFFIPLFEISIWGSKARAWQNCLVLLWHGTASCRVPSKESRESIIKFPSSKRFTSEKIKLRAKIHPIRNYPRTNFIYRSYQMNFWRILTSKRHNSHLWFNYIINYDYVIKLTRLVP